MPEPQTLNQMEVEVLRILNGEDVPGWTWGAGMASVAQSLCSYGYAAGSYHITQAGKDYLAAAVEPVT